jgi:methylthioribulose-1-phosphate dehydratase
MPPLSPASLALRHALITLGSRYHRAGWLYGTSGNLSARFEAGDGPRVVVTASGRDKGQLEPEDFVEVDLAGTLLAAGQDARPSAETSIHLALYRTRPSARVVLHVHTVSSTLASAEARLDASPPDRPRLNLSGLELTKGWGLWDEGAIAELPLFPNHADVPQIARDIEDFYTALPDEPVPSLLIASHGITAWGDDAASANRHLEVTEFMCQLALARRHLRG